MTPATATKLEVLAHKLGQDALGLLIKLCPEIRTATEGQRELALVAMRVKSKEVIGQMLDDAKDVPHLAHLSYHTAALTLAQAGAAVLRCNS